MAILIDAVNQLSCLLTFNFLNSVSRRLCHCVSNYHSANNTDPLLSGLHSLNFFSQLIREEFYPKLTINNQELNQELYNKQTG